MACGAACVVDSSRAGPFSKRALLYSRVATTCAPQPGAGFLTLQEAGLCWVSRGRAGAVGSSGWLDRPAPCLSPARPGTITNAARVLHAEGAREVYACAPHAVFSPPAVERLSSGLFQEVRAAVVCRTCSPPAWHTRALLLQLARHCSCPPSQHELWPQKRWWEASHGGAAPMLPQALLCG